MRLCMADNTAFFHSDASLKESYRTVLGIIIPVFTKCEHQVFDGWHCLVCQGNLIEEKVVRI